MPPLLIAMTLLGCSDAGDQCQAVRVLPARYATVAACDAAAGTVLMRSEVTHPVMAVHCQKIDAPTIALAAR